MRIVDKLLGRHMAEADEVVAGPVEMSGSLVMPAYLRVGAASHVGLVRSHNEDALLMVTAGQVGYLGPDDPFGLFILADGMGGQQAGEVASLLATRTVTRHLLADILGPYLDDDAQSPPKTIAEALSDAVQAADAVVLDHAPGGGTTLTCALIMGGRIYIGHVGDSRAYVFADGVLRQITHDHSLVDRLVEMGQLSPEEALHHPQRNVVYRAVGQGDGLEVDTHVETMPAAGQLLLCSDGLWGMVDDEHIAAILAAASFPQQACDALIEAANHAGGKDNITVVIVEGE
jgi:serine/threonine protein phosphatase PrpC